MEGKLSHHYLTLTHHRNRMTVAAVGARAANPERGAWNHRRRRPPRRRRPHRPETAARRGWVDITRKTTPIPCFPPSHHSSTPHPPPSTNRTATRTAPEEARARRRRERKPPHLATPRPLSTTVPPKPASPRPRPEGEREVAPVEGEAGGRKSAIGARKEEAVEEG